MKARSLFGVALVVGMAGAVALAQQQRDRTPSPFGTDEIPLPDFPGPSEDPLTVPPSVEEPAGFPVTIPSDVGSPFEAVYPGSRGVVQVEDEQEPDPFFDVGPQLGGVDEFTGLPLPEAVAWDSEEFIEEGRAKASEAIEALTAERDALQTRLETIERELARWQAIDDGLTAAKDATSSTLRSRPEPIEPPPDDDQLSLCPLPESSD